MLPRTFRKFFSSLTRTSCLAATFLVCCTAGLSAENNVSNVVVMENVSEVHRQELSAKLRRITGLPELGFDANGGLRLGAKQPVGGSPSARELLEKAITGTTVIVVEDASNRPDVAFCSVFPGRWLRNARIRPAAFVLMIDFSDFQQVVGDRRAREAFDTGWAVLHELDHVVNDSRDASGAREVGPCEDHINKMRRELKLPERTEYFYTLFPERGDGNLFPTRFVRLAFEGRDESDKKKRYWLMWDAAVVGGLVESKELARLK
jgi:hypothetical protein